MPDIQSEESKRMRTTDLNQSDKIFSVLELNSAYLD